METYPRISESHGLKRLNRILTRSHDPLLSSHWSSSRCSHGFLLLQVCYCQVDAEGKFLAHAAEAAGCVATWHVQLEHS